MQAPQDESDLCPPTAPSAEAEGVSPRPGQVGRVDVFKPGWVHPAGWGRRVGDVDLVEREDFTFFRVELADFRLSHAASLFLLQGASLRMLFDNVVVRVGDRPADFYSLVFASVPQLFIPPQKLDRLVLAHIFERPANITPDALYEQLFMGEMKRSSSF